MSLDRPPRSSVRRSLGAVLLLALAGPGWGQSVPAAAEPVAAALRAAALPLQSREATVREFARLFRAVGQAAGRPVEFVYHERYEAVLDELLSGRLDLAYLGPLPYVELMRRDGQAASPLVRFRERDGSGLYRCALVTFPDNFPGSALTGPLPALAGRRLVMPQALSTCGPHAARRLLAGLGGPGLQALQTQYAGRHEAVAQQVVAGKADLGTLKESVAEAYRVLGLQVLATTDPMPGFVLVVRNAALPPAQRSALRDRLLAWPAAEQRQWGDSVRWGLEPAADADYDAVRALLHPGRP